MKVLITGMSGAGKSSVVRGLRALGHPAVDLDDPAWSEYRHLDDPDLLPVGTAPEEQEWLWREDRVARLLATSDTDVLFVAGCAANQGRFYDRFDRVVLLTAPAALTIRRLRTRTTNRFGHDAAEVAKVLADKASVEPVLRRRADLVLDTSAPLEAVVQAVLDLGTSPAAARGARPAPGGC